MPFITTHNIEKEVEARNANHEKYTAYFAISIK